jgi:hypothetical protein
VESAAVLRLLRLFGNCSPNGNCKEGRFLFAELFAGLTKEQQKVVVKPSC